MFTELLKEAIGLGAMFGGIPLQSVNGSYYSGTLDMSLFNRGQFLVGIGAGTANVYLQQCNFAQNQGWSGVGASNLSMSPTNALALTPNTFGSLEVRSDEMTSRYLTCLIVTSSGALAGPSFAPTVFAVGLGHEGRYDPANSRDNTYIAGRSVCNI